MYYEYICITGTPTKCPGLDLESCKPGVARRTASCPNQWRDAIYQRKSGHNRRRRSVARRSGVGQCSLSAILATQRRRSYVLIRVLLHCRFSVNRALLSSQAVSKSAVVTSLRAVTRVCNRTPAAFCITPRMLGTSKSPSYGVLSYVPYVS